MREAAFLTILGRSVREAGARWHKYPDPAKMQFAQNHANRFVERRPYDAEIIAHKLYVAVEAKVLRARDDYLRLEPHQEQNLLDITRYGHQAYVVVRVEYRSLARDQARVFAIPIERYRTYLVVTGRKAVPRRDVDNLGIQLIRLPNVGWDVNPLLGGQMRVQQPLAGPIREAIVV